MTTTIKAQVRAILDPGPWQIVPDLIAQGFALWRAQGKSIHKPWELAKRRTAAQQCTACGAIFGGVAGFHKHRKGGRCNDPTDVGLSRAADGVWARPRPEFADAEGVWRADDPYPTRVVAPLARCPQVHFSAGIMQGRKERGSFPASPLFKWK